MFDREFMLEYFKKLLERIEKEKIISRELEVSTVPNKVVVIAGPRRSGKTFLLFSKLKEDRNSMYVDLEHSAFRYVTHKDFFEIISIFEEYFGVKLEKILIDEVQKIEEWERLVRSLLDSYEIIISGSSSKLLPKEIATTLRGRSLTYLLLPLSFREYLNFKGVKAKNIVAISEKVKLVKELEEFLGWGGYPEIVIEWDKKEKILREYFETIFQKDFVERFEIVNVNVARLIFEFIIKNFSGEISTHKIANFVSSMMGRNVKNMVYDYVEKLPETFTSFFVEKFERSVYKRKSFAKKVYICDLGLTNLLMKEKDLGKRMENSVFLELIRKINERPLIEIFYFKDYQQNEVDFVLKEGLRIKQLVQVTCASGKDEVEKREVKALVKAGELLKCKDLLVITWDYEDEARVGNKKIVFKPLWKWLLS
jgi:predicted AAA+ superfamily ATPase